LLGAEEARRERQRDKQGEREGARERERERVREKRERKREGKWAVSVAKMCARKNKEHLAQRMLGKSCEM